MTLSAALLVLSILTASTLAYALHDAGNTAERAIRRSFLTRNGRRF